MSWIAHIARSERKEAESHGKLSLAPPERRAAALAGVATLATLLLIFPGPVEKSIAQARPKGNPQRGERIYRALCWTCHGRYGRGDGPAAQYLAALPPDFTDPATLQHLSDETLIKLLSGKGEAGGPHRIMAVGEILKKGSLRDAIAYVRTLAVPGKHVSIQAGRDIYETFCWSCHGINGDGKGPTAKNLAGAKPRDFRRKDFIIEGREEEIYRAIFEGAAKAFHGSPYMPEWKNTLSRQQILDVMEYLKTFKQ